MKLSKLAVCFLTICFPFASHAYELGWMDEVGFLSSPYFESYYFPPWGESQFGDFYILDAEIGLIYHPRTASNWYMYGESPDSLFLYGPKIAQWVWTSKDYYPWLYFYGSKDWDLIPTGWGHLDYIMIRLNGEVWAYMTYYIEFEGRVNRQSNVVFLPF